MTTEQQVRSLLAQRLASVTTAFKGEAVGTGCPECGGKVKVIGAPVFTQSVHGQFEDRWDYVQCESCGKTAQLTTLCARVIR